LFYLARKFAGDFINRFLSKIFRFPFFYNFAFNIESISGNAKFNCSYISFVAVEKVPGELCCTAGTDNEQS
jgi:hypothetical protein